MKRSALACLVLSSLFAACGSTQKDWDRANTTGTPAAYQEFLQRHPKDAHAEEARERMRTLEDAQAWSAAETANTAEAYQQYLQSEPAGGHAQAARDKLAAIQAAAAEKVAQSDSRTDAPQEQLASSYRIQLGAFRTKKQAQHARAQLKSRYGKILRDVVLVAPKPPEKLTRVRSGPMSQSDARTACARLRKAHQHCEVVKD